MSNRSKANSTFARSIDSVGWALFFMWVGIAMLGSFSWTVSLIGTAVIMLGVQATLFFRRERLDIFMLAIGVVLLFGTITDMYGLPWTLVPGLLILIGIMMLADTLRPHSGEQTDR